MRLGCIASASVYASISRLHEMRLGCIVYVHVCMFRVYLYDTVLYEHGLNLLSDYTPSLMLLRNKKRLVLEFG
jgi:hypothetical protein